MPDKACQTDDDLLARALLAIREDTKRNADVAEKYKDRAESIFAVVDRVTGLLSGGGLITDEPLLIE